MSLCKRLVAKQIVTAKVVAEFLQEAEDVGDAVDGWKVEGVLFSIKQGCEVKKTGLSMSGGQFSAVLGRPARRVSQAYLVTQRQSVPRVPPLPPSHSPSRV